MPAQAGHRGAAPVLAPGRWRDSAGVERAAAGRAEVLEPGGEEEAEPRRPAQAEPGQGSILGGGETLRPLQAALPATVQLLSSAPSCSGPLRFPVGAALPSLCNGGITHHSECLPESVRNDEKEWITLCHLDYFGRVQSTLTEWNCRRKVEEHDFRFPAENSSHKRTFVRQLFGKNAFYLCVFEMLQKSK